MATRKAHDTKKTKASTKTKTAKRAPTKKATKPAPKKAERADEPNLFRINIEVGDLDAAASFYGTLLGQAGRKQAGSRVYFTCGGVTLQVVDVSSEGEPHTAAKALYFLVKDLDAIFARCQQLGGLSKERVHGTAAGEIAVRPWGERSFYAEDPWHNPLCFVEAGTTYPG